MKIAIVLTGYYYKYFDLYERIKLETELYSDINFELYISSHKKEAEISESVLQYLKKNNWTLVYFPNEGWDWGCHSDFVNYYFDFKNIQPDYFLFLHDDLKIIKNGFIKAFLRKVKAGYSIIGNSLPFTEITDYPGTFPEEKYILEKAGYTISEKSIQPVRGSAFFIVSKLLSTSLKNLPYQRKGRIDLANRSLRMFASIISNHLPHVKTGYLSSKHFKSPYIVEEMRGIEQNNTFFIKRRFIKLLKKIKIFSEAALIELKILKRQKAKKGKIRINISNKMPLPGYLNYDVSDLKYSDITNIDQELKFLLKNELIYQIKIAPLIINKKKEIIKKVINIAKSFNTDLDIIIEGELPIIPLNDNDLKMHTDYSLKYGEIIPKRRALLRISR